MTMTGSKDMLMRARYFATAAHGAIAQKRKYTGEDYIVHPIEVMELLATVGGFSSEVLQAALLHDVLEDTNVKADTLFTMFGDVVTQMVLELTDVSKDTDGARAVRKKIDREHSARASADAQSIKIADLISNTKTIVKYDKSFAKVFLEEKALLISVLTNADPRLKQMAVDSLTEAQKSLA